MRKFFGTDGIRGQANTFPITAEMALKVGMAAGIAFKNGGHRHRVVIGKDTRLSGYMIENALVAGFTSVGMDAFLLGPMPTPSVAMLTHSLRADLGVMISASHNPFQDNGIKFFGPDGFKLSDAIELEIERIATSDMSALLPGPKDLGRAKRIEGAQQRYIEFAKRTLPREMSLEGLRVAIDCANGAAYKVAPEALWELGADVISLGVSPDGFNINKDCGSTSTDALIKKVHEVRADIGIALDGDADRVIIVDENGQVVDGDQLMAVVAQSWKANNRLTAPGIVATVMSNLGLERYLQSLDLGLVRTKVGDRYVVERMRADGYNVGGEQSGGNVQVGFRHHRGRPDRSPADHGLRQGSEPAGVGSLPALRTGAAVPEKRPLPGRRAAGTGRRQIRDPGRRRPSWQERPPCHPRVRHRTGHPCHGGRRRRGSRQSGGQRYRGFRGPIRGLTNTKDRFYRKQALPRGRQRLFFMKGKQKQGC